jgi:hypothetical protein
VLQLDPASDAIAQLHSVTPIAELIWPYQKIALCRHSRIHVMSPPTLAEKARRRKDRRSSKPPTDGGRP